MVKAITPEKKHEILDRWLKGETYSQISKALGVSEGIISKFVNDWNKKEQDLNQLRELRKHLSELGTTAPELQHALAVCKIWDRLGIPAERLNEVVALLDRYGPQAPDVLNAGLVLEALVRKRGISYDSIVADAESKSKFLDEYNAYITQLKAKARALQDNIGDLQKLTALARKLEDHRIGIETLGRFIDNHSEYQRLGFNEQSARILASELAKIGLDPQSSSQRLADLLRQYKSAEEAVSKLMAELHVLEQKEREYRGIVSTLDDRCKVVQSALSKLESTYKEREKEQRERLASIHESEVRKLRLEYENKKEAFRKEIVALESQLDSLDDEVSKLKQEQNRLRFLLDTAFAIKTILRSPELVSDDQIIQIDSELWAAYTFRRQGDFAKVNENVARAREEILKSALDLISPAVVKRSDYEQLQEESKKLLEEREQLKATNNDKEFVNQKLQSDKSSLRNVLDFLFPKDKHLLESYSLRCEHCGVEKAARYKQEYVSRLLETGYFPFVCANCKKENKATIDYLLEHLSRVNDSDNEEEEGAA